MNAPEDNSDFERRTKAVFDRSLEQLDASTRTHLAAARATALNDIEPPTSHRRWRVWAPVAGVAAAALGSVAVLFGTRHTKSQGNSPLDDLDLLANDEPDMVQDLDFYAWLDDQPEFKG